MNNKLNNYGVSTVIAIDDIFNKPKSTDLLTEFKLDIIEDLTGDYDRYREYTVDEYIEETGENDFIEKLYETAINSNSYKWLEDEGVEVHKIGADISEVQKQLENIDSSDKSRKNLVILDRVLQPTVYGVENNELLTSILNIVGQSLTDKNLLLLIYTDNEIPAELDTFDGVKSYLKNQLKVEEKLIDQIALHFNYVKKTSELSSDFFDNILKSQKANYIQEYTNIFEESYAKLAERLWELNRNPVLFYYDYLNEGQHADDIMYDTFVSKFNQVYSKTFGQNGKYSDLINPIRRSMREHLVEVTGADLNIYRNLKEFEIALHNEENLLEISDSSDISFGDVLQIGEKFYMIMSQDCDIALRNNGKRKLKFIQLVGLELKKEVNRLSDLNNKYEKEISKLKVKATSMMIDTDIKKLILKEFARNKGNFSIFRELNKTYNIGIEEIREITENIDKLDSELIEYYKKEAEAFKNNDFAKYISKKELLGNSIEDTLGLLTQQIVKFNDKKDLSEEDMQVLKTLLTLQKDYIKLQNDTTITYREEDNIANNQKEQGNELLNNVTNEIKQVINIQSLKIQGIPIKEVEIDHEVIQYD